MKLVKYTSFTVKIFILIQIFFYKDYQVAETIVILLQPLEVDIWLLL